MEAFCGPAPPFPAVGDTDALQFIDDLAAAAPAQNRVGFRLLLRFVDVAPFLRGERARFTRLPLERRREFLHGLDKSRWLVPRVGARLLKTLSVMSYYGDSQALRASGYDPDWNVARARALREREGR
jgi:hypothetical protein